MRILGTVIGCVLALLALIAIDCADHTSCEREDWKAWFITIWICAWCIPLVIIGAARDPLMGFDRSFGYAFQVPLWVPSPSD